MKQFTRSLVWILALLLFVPTAEVAFAHKQHVHQYIVSEAYFLLMQKANNNILELPLHIGSVSSIYAADSAWQRPYVTTGAWREDEEDVVFGYDQSPFPPIQNYALVSITHFWDADDGDLTKNMFRLTVENPWPIPPVNIDIGPYENAFDKFKKFADGGWVAWYPRSMKATNASNNHILLIAPLPDLTTYGIPLSYDSLTKFYTSSVCRLRSDAGTSYEIFDANDLKLVDPNTISLIVVEDDVRDHIAWEVLGRMCHLLGDMSVPAHAHRDEHGLNPDSYEEYMGDASNNFAVWDHLNSGEVLDPYTTDQDALHFLMYVMQQQSDHFGSNGPAEGQGNDNLTGTPRSSEIAFLNGLPLGALGPPTGDAGPWTTENLNNIRDKTFPFVIRATAGLLYWFCREAGLMGPLNASEETTAPTIPVSNLLLQNYPNPFNGSSNIGFTIRETSRVRLSVFDILGREVATLVNEEKAPGSYRVTWNAEGKASGIYLYRLQANGYTATKRMTLTK